MNDISIVSRLPDELLEAIFIPCVHFVEISPVVLSQVCKLWREVVLRSARLWTTIDLTGTTPERAKRHFELSRKAQLNVLWLNRNFHVVAGNPREWIFAHASRYSDLSLVDSTGVVNHILEQIGNNLSALLSFTVIAENYPVAHSMPISFNLTMPCLQKLALMDLVVSMSDFFSVLQNAPLLEAIEISQVTFAWSQSQLSDLNRDSIPPSELLFLPHLRQFEFLSLNPFEEAYIFMRVRLPASCSLQFTEFSNRRAQRWRTRLHPITARHLGSLAFSTFKLASTHVELVREATEEHHALSLRVINKSSIEVFLDIHTLDTSRLYRVEIDSTAYPELRQPLERLFESVPATKTLVLYKKSTELLPQACKALPQLREIELEAVDLDGNGRGELTACIAETLRDLFRWRKEQRSDTFCPVEQLVLRHCDCTPRSLKILQDEVKLVIT